MTMPLSQVALHRVLNYLKLAGLGISPEVEKRALQLVTQALDSAPEEVLAESMRLVPQYFTMPQAPSLQQAPAVNRGSLFYGAY
ncbi:MAG: hypothetical protein V7751_10300 [Pseudoalteromonas distincta]